MFSAEGFDEVRYVWNNQKISQEYLNEWCKKKKMEYPVTFKKGESFGIQQKLWQQAMKDWKSKQAAWKTENDKKKKEEVNNYTT